MKFLISLCCVCVSLVFAQAQVTTPSASPLSILEQKVGLTDVTIEYSRPSAKDRVVFGELVPYNEVWRAGANQATKITFSSDVKVGGMDLKAGSYAVLITPGKESWQVHFFTHNSGNWGSYIAEDAAPEVAVLTAKTAALPFKVETWTIGIGGLSNHGATLDFIWESTYTGLDITVPTEAAVTASIEKTMAGPSAGDYSAAASYYLSEGKDLKQALSWINTSLEKGGERFWLLRTKALIQAGLGDKTGAIETAKRSTQLAQEAGNEEYLRMNAKSISEWVQ